MAEYIDKELLIAVLKNREECVDCTDTDCVDCVCDFIACIVPSDVEPVRRGKWIRHEKDGAIFAGYECSICSAYPTDGIRSYFCPNCGSKMELRR